MVARDNTGVVRPDMDDLAPVKRAFVVFNFDIVTMLSTKRVFSKYYIDLLSGRPLFVFHFSEPY